MTNSLGLYIHVPFCLKKCNYCDFYSLCPDSDKKGRYIDRVCSEIEKWGTKTASPVDSLYFGGGTPSLLSEAELSAIISSVKKSFSLTSDAEITCEINPGDNDKEFLSFAKRLGVNRISVGVQSADDSELNILGRRHTFLDAVNTINTAKTFGFSNISADLMIGLPDSNSKTLQKSIEEILSLDTQHISAYILKIEQGTPFSRRELNIPDEDGVADQYLQMCNCFEQAGFEHYEISNFAKKGFQSRHNNRYWKCQEYIGIGPSAHSFFKGERFFYPENIDDFLTNPVTVSDGLGGDKKEFVMLCLRLKQGLIFEEYEHRFGEKINDRFVSLGKLFEKNHLCKCTKEGISLTNEGMLVSNSVITELIGELYEDI